MSSKNQLFRKIPSLEIALEIVRCFGLSDFDDNRNFSRKDLIIFNSVEKIKEMKKELEEYYIPCKARTYLNDLNTKNVITVLRQIVKCHGYTINSREKYIRGDKFIIYQLTPIETYFYRPINLEINDKKQCVVRFD